MISEKQVRELKEKVDKIVSDFNKAEKAGHKDFYHDHFRACFKSMSEAYRKVLQDKERGG